MNNEAIKAIADLSVSLETLRAFAKGQLDEEQEQHVLDLLEEHPELAAQVAAISVDSVVAKMRDHSKLASEKSLSSQLAEENLGETEMIGGPIEVDSKIQLELKGLTDFKIIKEIGRGGMGVIFLAQHILTGREEVLKVLNERLVVNREARKRFEQEIKCIAATNHESIVRCYTVKQLRDTVVLCMEYVPGKNLHQVIAANGPLPIHVACAITIKICLGLQHAMQHGLIHRDIKPSNIMLSKQNGRIQAKILDFGLARLTTSNAESTGDSVDGLTDDGVLLGTLEYIAPEQCRDAASADIRSDIYSLGCTVYHMIVGHPPFSGSTGELVLAHSQMIPPTIDRIRPEVPKGLSDVVEKMLHKDPSDRYATPTQVAEALKPFARRGIATEKHSSQEDPESKINDNRIESGNEAEPPVADAVAESAKAFLNHSSARRRLAGALAVMLIGGLMILGMNFTLAGNAGRITISDLPKNAVVQVDGQTVPVDRSGTTGTIIVKQGEREIAVTVTGTKLLETRINIRRGVEETLQVDIKEQRRSQAGPANSIDLQESARLPELFNEFAELSTFNRLLIDERGISEDRLLENFETNGIDYAIDQDAGTVRFSGRQDSGSFLSTKRKDLRNFHLRVQIKIDSSNNASLWNQHFVLRANRIGEDKVGWRAMLGGHRPHAGVMHQVAPFGLMGILVKPFPGYPDGNIGVPYFAENRLNFFQVAPEQCMTRDEFHVVEYIVYGRSIEVFLDGRFVCSATDSRDRVDRGGIILMKAESAIDFFREFSILELGDDSTAERYAKAMALALAGN
ncbi:serine/threonine protein kinase [Roseiconus lacunae]|uniref:Serine/threonine-protein kinase n=1 Tax=Roseiconus lacunae TaxID=2605694 RepID=A0ABT7PDS9_9BACT|nr:serine/threonine-protein kinase [Roseiconus lacunae]MDM4014645.1 serine/threonine-protein kinase [Roseiconus lacunae]